MGCCVSTPSTSSPYPSTSAEPSSSSRAINHSQSQPASNAALHRPSTNQTADSTSRRDSNTHSHRPRRPLSEHFTKPLKLHVWTSTDKVWTRNELDREREAFFDTRVSGRPEIWMTIRAALEVLWIGGAGEDDDGGISTAQSILDAADITLPTGDMANGVYDAFGAFYSLPEWVVADPDNLAPGLGADDEDKSIGAGSAGSPDEEEDGEELLRRREEKGKAVVAEADLIRVKARLSDRGGPDVSVTIGKDDSVRLLTRRVFEEAGLSLPQRIRFCYMGKMLKENEPLVAQGWKEDHIVNALVFGS